MTCQCERTRTRLTPEIEALLRDAQPGLVDDATRDDGVPEFESSTAIPCPAPPAAPPPGKFARSSLARSAACRNGLWYMPAYGDTLSRVARDILRANPGKLTATSYISAISDHPDNRDFRSAQTGLATRAFLPRWNKRTGRGYVGTGGGYGLLFFPAFGGPLVSPYGPLAPNPAPHLVPELEAILANVPRASRDLASAADELEVTAPPATRKSCVKSFTVGGFSFAVNALTRAQKELIARIARDLISGGPGVPPLARAHNVLIVGFASGTRNLTKHANLRATSVFEELTKQLRDRGATARDIAKIAFGDPVTALVASQTASDPSQRKVEICIERPAPPTARPKPTPKSTTARLLRAIRGSTTNSTTRCIAEKLLDAKVDHSYLPLSNLSSYMSMDARKTGTHGHLDHLRDLKEDMDANLRRIQSTLTAVPGSRASEEEARFRASLARAQSDDLVGVARHLKMLNCHDPRTRFVRQYILDQSRRPNTLYSCPVIKALIERAIKDVGGVRGCVAA